MSMIDILIETWPEHMSNSHDVCMKYNGKIDGKIDLIWTNGNSSLLSC